MEIKMKNNIDIEVKPRLERTNIQRLVTDLWIDPAFKELREKMGGEFVCNLATRIEGAAMRDAETMRRMSELTIANLSATADRLSSRVEELINGINDILRDRNRLLREKNGAK